MYTLTPVENVYMLLIKWASTRENLSSGVANNTGADQPAHPCSLLSASVSRLFESIISRLDTTEISVFLRVSVAEETGLSLALSEAPKACFGATWRKLYRFVNFFKGRNKNCLGPV